VQVFPGTSLESLKLRFGDAQAEIRGDLELQELERQQQEEAKQREEEAKKAEERLQNAAQLEPLQDAEPPAADSVVESAPAPAPAPKPKPQAQPVPLPPPAPQL
jgi:predicted Holliday junction resolvase-like endonuclease